MWSEFQSNSVLFMHMPANMSGCVGVWVIPAPSLSLSVVPAHAVAAWCRLSGFSKGTLWMSGQIPGIKEAGTTRRCSFSILLTFRMATTAFICDVEDSEGSVGSHKIKQQVRSYTLLHVLVGVLVVLVLALTGGFIWMMCSQVIRLVVFMILG